MSVFVHVCCVYAHMGVDRLCSLLIFLLEFQFSSVQSSTQSCLTLCDPVDYGPLAPLSVEFSRQEYWRGLSCPSPEEMSDSGIKPVSPVSPALQMDSLPAEHA